MEKKNQQIAVEKTFRSGVSIIVFTYNSSKVISRTLQSLLSMPKSPYPCEILVIDNNSKDNTIDLASEILSSSSYDFKVIHQPIQGLFHSRIAGIKAASYEYFIFVDDDNLLKDDWVSSVYMIFEQFPNVALLGGVNEAVLEEAPPEWWSSQKHAFAVGKSTKETGVVSDAFAIVWGAGMSGRTSLIRELYENAKFWLIGRRGNQLLAGEDSELTFWVRMLGYNTYQSELKLDHVIAGKKLTDQYLLELHKGFRQSDQYLEQYRIALTSASWFVGFVQYGIWLKLKWLLFPLRIILASTTGSKMDLRTKRPTFKEVWFYWWHFRRWKKIYSTICSLRKKLTTISSNS